MSMIYTAKDLEKLLGDSVSKATAEIIKARREASTERGRDIKQGLVASPDAVENQERHERLHGKITLGGKYLKSLLMGKGNMQLSREYAEERYAGDEALVKALSSSVFADGGSIIPPAVLDEIIELLRNRMVVMALGARVVQMETGQVTAGSQTGSATATYGEEGADTNASQLTTGDLNLTAKELTAISAVSNKLLRRAANSEQLVREDLIAVVALRKDLALLRGTGAASTPKGIRNRVAAANVFATTGATVTTITNDTTKQIRLVEEGNHPEISRAWIMNARQKWFLSSLRDGNNNLVFADEIRAGTFWGFPLGSTEQIPNNLGAGSDESEVYFQEMSEVMVGETLNMQLAVQDGGSYVDSGGTVRSAFARDETVLRLIDEHDVILRHDDSGAILTGVQWGA